MTTAPHRDRREAGSIPLALLLTVVGVTLSALLLPMVLNQTSSTREDVHRVAGQRGERDLLERGERPDSGIQQGTSRARWPRSRRWPATTS